MKIFKTIYLCIFFCLSVSVLSGQIKKDECVLRGSISGVKYRGYPSSFLLDSNGKIILGNDNYYNLADTIKSKIEKN
jgi:hypothetical protein